MFSSYLMTEEAPEYYTLVLNILSVA